MTLLDVKRDPLSGHYDLHLRLTEAEALDLAHRIVRCAETKPTEPPASPATPEGGPTDESAT